MGPVNWHTVFFLIFSLITCGFALAVVLSSHIVRMAFFLTISLGATAGLFFLAGADFVAAMQIMIYVGGTLVLLIFGVMLTAQGPFVTMKTRGGDWVLAAILTMLLTAFLVPTAFSVADWRKNSKLTAEERGTTAEAEPTAAKLGMGLVGARIDKLDEPSAVRRAGMSSYLLPFEIVSVHLLVVLLGAGYLARTKRRAKSRSMTLSSVSPHSGEPA